VVPIAQKEILMDGKAFDRWTAAHAPARLGRRALLGGAFAALLALRVPLRDSAAKPKGGKGGKGKGKGCKGGTKKCGKRCISVSACCTADDCNLCQQERCLNDRCDCEPGAFRDAYGYCGTPPVCQVVDQLCERDDDCCSQQCNVPADDGSLRCNRGLDACITNLDCLPGWFCRGFDCKATPICP